MISTAHLMLRPRLDFAACKYEQALSSKELRYFYRALYHLSWVREVPRYQVYIGQVRISLLMIFIAFRDSAGCPDDEF